MRQKHPNYFSMRLKFVGGHFTAEQLGTIQKVAEKFGKGYVHLTSRQGIENPFIHLDNFEEVKKKFVGCRKIVFFATCVRQFVRKKLFLSIKLLSGKIFADYF